MASNDVYEDLFEMYSIFNVHMVKDTIMEVMRCQFTPDEAELAVKVGFAGGRLDDLQKTTGMERSSLKKMLTTMRDKGTVWIDPGQEYPNYKVMGLAGPGLVETGGWGNIRFPHSVRLLKALHHFEVDFATKWLPAVGVPVTRVWLTPDALPEDATPEENVAEMIRRAGKWGVSTCSCRLPHWIADPGNHCDHLLEVCIFTGDMVRWGLECGNCREITYEEAMDILKRSNENGLVHTHDPNEFICNCCNDCCVMLMGGYRTGAKTLHPSEFIPTFDEGTCSACGVCEERCPVDAITMDGFPSVNLDKCLGCGVCFPTCPTESIKFVRRPTDN